MSVDQILKVVSVSDLLTVNIPSKLALWVSIGELIPKDTHKIYFDGEIAVIKAQ